ncbi:hypothetical protein RFI_06644 [Reticulomyxa filosa]|uniref:Uncharacterized protein n=1 Tax=Reticulomyxa filosa TaxID=46433 RepID=X6NW01_RETFI|nr:hypothetical protein RFI_06644 [Reticulomyxa filosa]|eukprot:ETO30475.1 hypothetical protein RFI_06644 [Reticulomyxa filosa]
MRAIIGGSANHLLFITHSPANISVFNLNIFQYIKHETLPSDIWITYHCFVPKNKKSNEMLLFCKKTGLSIKYDEDHNTFEIHKIRVCTTINSLHSYACICVDDFILFLWMRLASPLPIAIANCVAVLSEDNAFVHILGFAEVASIHIKTKLKDCMGRIEQWVSEDKEIIDIEDVNIELEEMKQNLDITK